MPINGLYCVCVCVRVCVHVCYVSVCACMHLCVCYYHARARVYLQCMHARVRTRLRARRARITLLCQNNSFISPEYTFIIFNSIIIWLGGKQNSPVRSHFHPADPYTVSLRQARLLAHCPPHTKHTYMACACTHMHIYIYTHNASTTTYRTTRTHARRFCFTHIERLSNIAHV